MSKHSGGGNQAAKNILDCIIRNNKLIKNFEIHIIARSNFFEKNKLPRNIKKIHIPDLYYLNFVIRWFLLIFLSNKNYNQIYFCTNIYSPIFKLNFKIVNIFYDNQWKYYPENFSYIRLLWIKFNIFLSRIYSDKILCISDFIKNEFSKGDKKFIRVYIPVKNYKKSLKPKQIKNKFILTISSTLPHKNLKVLEKIYLNNSQSNLPKNFIIAGVGGEKKIITQKNNTIIYLGKIKESEKKWLLKNCEFYLYPSLYEGLGMTLIEALMENKKILCSDLKVFRETVGNYPIFIKNPTRISNWKNKIKEINKYKIKKNIISKIVKNFSSKKISDQYLDIFQQLIK
jgi:hypothetical protein